MLRLDPNLAKLLADSELPMCNISSAEILDPTRRIPNADMPDPQREHLRIDIALPICTKSRSEIFDPSLDVP
jgi:hypothetical protein